MEDHFFLEVAPGVRLRMWAIEQAIDAGAEVDNLTLVADEIMAYIMALPAAPTRA